MSPHAVNSLVSDLVSMAKAVEELPLVQEALEKSQHEARDYADLVHNREAEIASLRKQIHEMTDRIHTAEVARDDAELRFLELEERFGKVAAAITMASKAMDVADAMAKPEPVKSVAGGEAHSQPEQRDDLSPAMAAGLAAHSAILQGETTADATQGQRATDPSSSASVQEGSSQTAGGTASPTDDAASPSRDLTPAASSEGVSVPTDPSPSVSTEGQSQPVSSWNAAEPTAASGQAGDPSKPYLGMLYREVPGYVSFADWINGGGREGDYYIR